MSFRTAQGDGVIAEVRRDVNGRIAIQGQLTKTQGQKQSIRWMAPTGAHRTSSFNGSGLPYHDADQAFDNTTNKGLIESRDGSFKIFMDKMPSAYYTGLGSVYVPPVVMLETRLSNGESGSYRTHFFLSPLGVPFRWTAGSPPGPRVDQGPEENGRAMYYFGREELGLFQNQEAQLRYKGYPCLAASEQLPDNIDSRPWTNASPPS